LASSSFDSLGLGASLKFLAAFGFCLGGDCLGFLAGALSLAGAIGDGAFLTRGSFGVGMFLLMLFSKDSLVC
jgi:hypothetical protein